MAGFPVQATTPITLYIRHVDSDGMENNIRRVLNGCYWVDDSISTFYKTGQQTRHNVTIMIPYDNNVTGYNYVSSSDWKASSQVDDWWSIDQLRLPLVIRSIYNHEFTPAMPLDDNRISAQEIALESSDPNVRRVQDINERLFGTYRMRHVMLRC